MGVLVTPFDVALWCSWPSLFPEWIGVVEADNAFSAVVQLMHVYGLTEVAHAAASAMDGSMVYRCYRLRQVSPGVICFTRQRLRDGSRAFETFVDAHLRMLQVIQGK